MPDLTLRITGVEAAEWGIVPLLHFKLALENAPATEKIHSVIVQVQIQIQSPRRRYNDDEKARLGELFGPPEQWGQTLRNRLWTHAQVSAPSFAGKAEVVLPVQCTYDLNVASAKYFHALEGGDVPLLFLFSGTVFYQAADGRLQVQPIPWDKECEFRMRVETWRDLMEHHYPKSGFVSLHADLFERLYAYKRKHGLVNWEQAIARLLGDDDGSLTGLGNKAMAAES